MKSRSYSHKDNKALTTRELKALLSSIDDKALDKPVTMSSDEEGNEMLSLVSVDIHKSGKVTLWPAHL